MIVNSHSPVHTGVRVIQKAWGIDTSLLHDSMQCLHLKIKYSKLTSKTSRFPSLDVFFSIAAFLHFARLSSLAIWWWLSSLGFPFPKSYLPSTSLSSRHSTAKSYFLSIPELEKIPWIISWIRQEDLDIVVTATTLPGKLFHALKHLNSRLPCSQATHYIRNSTGHFSYSPVLHHTLLFTVFWLSKSIGNILSSDTGVGKTYWGIKSIFSKFTSKWTTVLLQVVFSDWFQPLHFLMSDGEWENILSGPERD